MGGVALGGAARIPLIISGKMSSGEMLREIADLEEQAADISPV